VLGRKKLHPKKKLIPLEKYFYDENKNKKFFEKQRTRFASIHSLMHSGEGIMIIRYQNFHHSLKLFLGGQFFLWGEFFFSGVQFFSSEHCKS
jgi:hypothetical protein